MAYEKQNFVDDEVLYAEQLNHIEDGIVAIEDILASFTNAAEVGM